MKKQSGKKRKKVCYLYKISRFEVKSLCLFSIWELNSCSLNIYLFV